MARKEKIGIYKPCEICGKEFYIIPHYIGKKKYCSKECKNKSLENGININCEECNKEFYIEKCNIGKRKYCSQECYRENYIPYNKGSRNIITICVICNKEFKPKPRQRKDIKCCSPECLHQRKLLINKGREHSEEARLNNRLRNIGKEGYNKGYRGGVYKNCIICDKEYYVDKSRDKNSKYCSRECSFDGRSIDCKGKIPTGFSDQIKKTDKRYNQEASFVSPYPREFHKMKKIVLKNNDGRCNLCFEEKPLVVHHIDYDKENNNIKNLIPLCHNCHAKTNGKREECQEFLKDGVEGLYVL